MGGQKFDHPDGFTFSKELAQSLREAVDPANRHKAMREARERGECPCCGTPYEWTMDIPTEPGFYLWDRGPEGYEPRDIQLCEIATHPDTKTLLYWVPGYPDPFYQDQLGGRWLRIQVPAP